MCYTITKIHRILAQEFELKSLNIETTIARKGVFALKIRDIPLHDMHLHIQKGQTLSSYLKFAESLGTEVMGVTEHLWDSVSIPTSEPYYQDKTLERVLALRKASQEFPVSGPLRILWGCETEYAAPAAQVGICPPRSDALDYVVIPHSHFFLPGFTFPAEFSQPEEIANYMEKTFLEVARLPMYAVIAHPFDPTAACFQQEDFLATTFQYLTVGRLRKCFSLAAKMGKTIEINLGSFVLGLRHPLYQKTYLPMFAIAKEEGCRFCLASDAQKPEDLSRLSAEQARFIIEALDLHWENMEIPGIDTF